MKFIKAKNYDEMSLIAAHFIGGEMLAKPDCVLGLATGSTPIGCYKEMIKLYNNNILDFSKVTSVNLDEYKGLSGDNDQSYRYFMNENLFQHVNIDKERTFVPDGKEPDSEKACKDFEDVLAEMNGVDLQLLGIGHNGHIGFNEPDDNFPDSTHPVQLAESTISANARFFDSLDDVPKEAYTMGIGTIMKAKKILILASGSGKAEIVKKAFFGPVTPQVPASILQFHNDVTIIGDDDSFAQIEV